jgi:hypothetical protein
MERAMSEAELILPNMRGGCVRVGNKVHALFRFTTSALRRHATRPRTKAGRIAPISGMRLPGGAAVPTCGSSH